MDKLVHPRSSLRWLRIDTELGLGTAVKATATAMNSFDSTLMTFLNGFAHRSVFFDTFVHMLSDNQLLKGGVIVAIIWWAWFRSDANKTRNRQYILSGIIACLLSVVVARGLAHSLPYRERPLRNPAIQFQLPYGTSQEELIDWSAFPSDHATVFFALATAILFAWRAAGIVAFCHALLLICLPRVYLGFHYPTDILGGAAIGIAIASLSRILVIRKNVDRFAIPWMESSPGSFYACMFILTFEIGTLFQSTRSISRLFFQLLKP